MTPISVEMLDNVKTGWQLDRVPISGSKVYMQFFLASDFLSIEVCDYATFHGRIAQGSTVPKGSQDRPTVWHATIKAPRFRETIHVYRPFLRLWRLQLGSGAGWLYTLLAAIGSNEDAIAAFQRNFPRVDQVLQKDLTKFVFQKSSPTLSALMKLI